MVDYFAAITAKIPNSLLNGASEKSVGFNLECFDY